MTRLEASYAFCEKLTRQAAGNFYPAMQLLPRRQRRAMYALYAFNRLTDDLADDDGPASVKEAALNQWRDKLDASLAGVDSHPALPALSHSVNYFHIPPRHLHAVIDGCLMDIVPRRFSAFEDLYRYCTLVASAVGQACIHIWGFRGEKAEVYAEKAGVALQLTNILRDLDEDRARGRVYLPQEDLKRFGCCAELICSSPKEPAFCELMRFEVARARNYYEQSRGLDNCLAPAGRAVFRVIFDTYRALLERIESLDYDVFAQRVKLSRAHKIGLVLRALPLRWGWSHG